jgi:heat shock protein HspQ
MAEEYRFTCDVCQYHTNRKDNWNRHLLSEAHKRGGKKMYTCELCNYQTKLKGDYEKHLGTLAHKEKEAYSKMSIPQKVRHHLIKAHGLIKEVRRLEKRKGKIEKKLHPKKGVIYLAERVYTPREEQWEGMVDRICDERDKKDDEYNDEMEKADALIRPTMETLNLTEKDIFPYSEFGCKLFDNWKQNVADFTSKNMSVP